MSTLRLILKPEHWPLMHRESFDALFLAGDLDREGPAARWAAGSRRKRTQSYGHWLGYLQRARRLSIEEDPADLFTPENIQGFVSETSGRISKRSLLMQIEDLRVLAKLMAPKRDWAWLSRLLGRIRRIVGPHQLKPRIPVTARGLLDWTLRRMASLADSQLHPTIVAQQYRDALSAAVLIARPSMRLRTFIALELSRHVERQGSDFVFQLAPKDVKEGRPYDFCLPDILVAPFDLYLKLYRPALLKGRQTNRLWVSTRGGPLAADSFQSSMERLSMNAFGLRITPHGFRSIAATSIALEEPDKIGMIPGVLGHTRLAMSQRHYNRAGSIAAVGAYQEILSNRRKASRSSGDMA